MDHTNPKLLNWGQEGASVPALSLNSSCIMRNPFFFFFFFSDGARQLAHHRWIVSAHGRTKGAGFILWIQWYANKLWEICANIFPFKIQGFVYDSLGHIYLPVPNLQCVFYCIHRRSKDYPTWSWFTGFLVIHRKRQVMTFQPYGITQCVCECVCVCVECPVTHARGQRQNVHTAEDLLGLFPN